MENVQFFSYKVIHGIKYYFSLFPTRVPSIVVEIKCIETKIDY